MHCFPGRPAACFGAWVLLGGAVAQASVLYLGLPSGRCAAYTTRGGHAPWVRVGWADLPDVGVHALPTLGDLDDDGVADALIGTNDGSVRAVRNAGTQAVPMWTEIAEWMPAVQGAGRPAPALGDLDDDGDPDLLVGAATGVLAAFENEGGGDAPRWRERTGWSVTVGSQEAHPALGDLDGDGRTDLVVGTATGEVVAFRNTGGRSPEFERAAAWDTGIDGTTASPALGDFDGDGRPDLVVTDGLARSMAFRNTGDGWEPLPEWAPPDPGSGPGVPALGEGELAATPPPSGGSGGGGGGKITARLDAAPTTGPAPLRVRFDARGSTAGDRGALAFAWSFGDGTTSPPHEGGDPAVLQVAGVVYEAAKQLRDDGRYAAAVTSYLALVAELVPLSVIRLPGPVSVKGTDQIDRVARWYLQKIAHDLGALYLFHDIDTTGCERYATSLLYSWESATQAVAGGFPGLPGENGTNSNIKRAEGALSDLGCEAPVRAPIFPIAEAPPDAGPVVEHEYPEEGTYEARVIVMSGTATASARVTITIGAGLPPPPGGPGDNDADSAEGFGAATPGGASGRVIVVREPTESAVRAAFSAANTGHAVVRFETRTPIEIGASLPRLEGGFITVDGNGATLFAPPGRNVNLVDVRGHDVIVKNIRLRGGYDNLRAVHGASNVVFSHVSSTGAADDGISVSHDAHDVTVQYCFLAGNTRSLFFKYGTTTNVSLHHSWILKQWSRGPLVSGGVLADIRNLIVEDWTMWGARFESKSSGNVVSSLFLLGPHAQHLGGKANGALRLTQSGPVFTAGNVYQAAAESGDEGASPAPLPAPPVTTHPVAQARDLVRARAGCLPRDAVDQTYVERRDGWTVTGSAPLRIGPGA